MKKNVAAASAKARSIAALAVVAIGLSGCTKTSDGSIEPIYPVPVPSYNFSALGSVWGKKEPQASNFPAPPPGPTVSTPRARAKPRKIRAANARVPKFTIATKPLFEPARQPEVQSPLACRNETSKTGRVKIVCG